MLISLFAETKKEDTGPDYFLSKYREIKEYHEGFEFILMDLT